MFIQYGRYSLFGSMSSKCTIQAPIGLEDIDIEQKCILYPVIPEHFYPFNASPHRPQALLFKRWLNVMPLALEILKTFFFLLSFYPFTASSCVPIYLSDGSMLRQCPTTWCSFEGAFFNTTSL